MLLKGVLERWPDLPAAAEAKKILQGIEAKNDRTWEKEDIAEQLRYFAAEARALGDYVLNGIPPTSPYMKQRPSMARRAIELWSVVIQNEPESAAATEGRKQVRELEKVARNKN